MTALIQIDRAVLNHLVEVGGAAPSIAIPLRLFRGEIPEGHPSLLALGLIEHVGGDIAITPAGREALA